MELRCMDHLPMYGQYLQCMDHLPRYGQYLRCIKEPYFGTPTYGRYLRHRLPSVLSCALLLVFSGLKWHVLSDPTLNERRSWSGFWVRLRMKSFLFGYPKNEKRQKSFPLSLRQGIVTFIRSPWKEKLLGSVNTTFNWNSKCKWQTRIPVLKYFYFRQIFWKETKKNWKKVARKFS